MPLDNFVPDFSEIVLHYFLINKDGSENFTTTEIQSSNEGKPVFSGVTHIPLSNSDWTENTNNLITFVGHRTLPKPKIGLQGLYKEEVHINLNDEKLSHISGHTVYVDNGPNFASQTTPLLFIVKATTGIFDGIQSIDNEKLKVN